LNNKEKAIVEKDGKLTGRERAIEEALSQGVPGIADLKELDVAVERIAASTAPPEPEPVPELEAEPKKEKGVGEGKKGKKSKADEEAKPTVKEFACPYCNNIFSAETTGVPLEVYCPSCNERVTVM
jgi:hypothetical protein